MTQDERDMHKKLAIGYFNKTWDLIDKKERTDKEDREMIHTAHASLYHWMQIGTPLEFARGEWQVSRVYSILGMGQSALYHGEASLNLCLDNGIGGFDLAFGYEAVARAYKTLGDEENKQKNSELALSAAEKVEDKGDRDYTLSEIGSI
ncbi:MAG: hypothetical protein JXN65_01965 [Clostridia bacterium]|nr:hypothetical protein [Clostridia bacterium]